MTPHALDIFLGDFADLEDNSMLTRDRAYIRYKKAETKQADQGLQVELIINYKGRALKGWHVVEWNNSFFWPKKAVREWVANNTAGEYTECPINAPRFFFKDEDDALLCYMAFK